MWLAVQQWCHRWGAGSASPGRSQENNSGDAVRCRAKSVRWRWTVWFLVLNRELPFDFTYLKKKTLNCQREQRRERLGARRRLPPSQETLSPHRRMTRRWRGRPNRVLQLQVNQTCSQWQEHRHIRFTALRHRRPPAPEAANIFTLPAQSGISRLVFTPVSTPDVCSDTQRLPSAVAYSLIPFRHFLFCKVNWDIFMWP